MAYNTGMRKGEILNLTWDRVNMKEGTIQLRAEDTKDREPRIIPIGEELMDILRGIPRSLLNPHVFLWKGKPVQDIRSGLKKACKEAGIEYGRFNGGFVFHDLRHTFNTNMRKSGVPESVIMAITGHSTRQMFDRYNTVDLDDTRNAVEQMGRFFRSVDQKVDQIENNETGVSD